MRIVGMMNCKVERNGLKFEHWTGVFERQLPLGKIIDKKPDSIETKQSSTSEVINFPNQEQLEDI